MNLLLVALGSFFIAEFLKAVLPWTFHPWTKMAAVALIAAALSAVLIDGWTLGVTVTIAGSGLAALFQKLHRLLSAVGDAQQVAVMIKSSPRLR